MGLLGSNFVKALLRRGEKVQVWNRTAARATALEAAGATAFTEAAAAVKGAQRIHLTLSEDVSVDETLQKASAGFAPGVIIVDHTTIAASGVAQRTQYWETRGYHYIHAPVFMGPSNALESSGFMLVSGNQSIIEKITPALAAMTGKLLNLGTEPGRAAGMKLSGNLILLSLTAGISDMLALAKSLEIPSTDIEALLAAWNPGNSLPARFKKIVSNQFSAPSWELNMARKDAGLMMQEAASHHAQLSIIPAIAAEMDKWIAKGHGHDDWTVIAKDNIPPAAV